MIEEESNFQKLPHNRIEAIHLSEAEKLQKVLEWTRDVPHTALLVGRPKASRKNVLAPLSETEAVPHFAEVALLRAYNQFKEGRDLMFYTQESPVKYKPKRLPELESAVTGLFPKVTDDTSYMEWGYSLAKDPFGEPWADAFAEDYYKRLTLYKDPENSQIRPAELRGRVTSEKYFGVPVLFFDKSEDLLSLKPYTWLQLSFPEGTQAISFVITKRSRPFVDPVDKKALFERETLNGILVVACLTSCPREVVKQHIRTQVAWRAAVEAKTATPVLMSTPIVSQPEESSQVSLEKAIEARIKANTIDLLVGERKSTSMLWQTGFNHRERLINSATNLLLVKDTRFDVTPWVNPLATKKQASIEKIFRTKMNKAFDVVNRFVNVRFKGVKEWELFTANLLASFPLSQWENVVKNFYQWEESHKNRFRKSLAYPRKSLEDI